MLRLLHLTAVLVALTAVATRVDAGLEPWTWRNPMLPADLRAVTHGDSGWVAVGDAGVVVTSADGTDWQVTPSGTTASFVSVVFGGGKYFAAASDGSAFLSDNGTSWTQCRTAQPVTGVVITGAAFGGGRYVMVRSDGAVVSSADTSIWTTTQLTVPNRSIRLSAVCYGGGLFVAVGSLSGDELLVYSSPDGSNWTRRGSELTNSGALDWAINGRGLTDVTYAQGRFVAVGESNVTVTSTDGVTWKPGVKPQSNGSSMTAVAYTDGRFFAGTSDYDMMMTSDDGIEWRQQGMPADIHVSPSADIVEFEGITVAVGGRSILTKNRGSDWKRTGELGASASDAAYGNGRFVTVNYATSYVSVDGRNWRASPSLSGDVTFSHLVFGNGMFLACGRLGTGYGTFTSVDGLVWTAHANTPSLNDIVFARGKFFAGGYNRVFSSADGITWSEVVFEGTGNILSSIADGNGRLVAVGGVGSASSLATSDDGVAWVLRTAPFQRASGIAFGAGRFVAVEATAVAAWTSVDGVAWSQVTLPTAPTDGWSSTCFQSITYADGWFVATAGVDVFTSTDGLSWQAAHNVFGMQKYIPTVLTYGNGTFVALSNGRVYQSAPSAAAVAITALSPVPVTASGQTVPLSVTASGSNLVYQWYEGMSGDTAHPISGATASTYTTPPLTGDAQFWVRVSNGITFVDSQTVVVKLARAPSITRQPADIDLFRGDTPIISFDAEGVPPPTAQWYRGAQSVVTDPVAGATSASFAPAGLTEPTRFWARAANSTGTADSRAAVVLPWEQRTPNAPAQDMIFANGLYVAVAGSISTSTDGVNWTRRYTPESSGLGARRIAYGNGRYVAISQDGQVVSADGVNWTVQKGNATNGYTSWISFGNGRFLAASSTGVVSSVDGLTWSPVSLPAGVTVHAAVFLNGDFVVLGVVSGSFAIFTSADAVTWQQHPGPWSAVDSNVGLRIVGSRLLAWKSSSLFLSSDVGRTWSSAGSVTYPWITDAACGNGVYVVAAGDGGLFRSTDGVTWVAKAPTRPMETTAVLFAGGRFLSGGPGGFVYESTDAQTWTPVVVWPSFPSSGLAYGKGRWVVTGTAQYDSAKQRTAYYSTDLRQWTLVANAPTFWARTIFAKNRFFSASRAAGEVLASDDGATWSTIKVSGAQCGYETIIEADDRLVALGGNEIAVSTDGVLWSAGSTNLGYVTRAVFGNGRYVAQGTGVFYSTDGMVWLPAKTTLSGTTGLAFGAGMFVSVGEYGRIYSSADGETWTACQIAGAGTFSDVIFAGGRFIATSSAAYFTSPDGVHWTRSQFGVRVPSGVIAYGDGMFVSAEFPAILQSARDSYEIGITSQPEDKAVASGSSVTLTVSASSPVAASYQWFRNGSAVAGATSASLTFANVQASDAGTYTVRITNAAGGAVVSRETTLIVDPAAPSITSEPASPAVNVGAPLTLSVAVSGNPAPRFQWSKNGTPIPGATNATLSFAATALTDAASYTVAATNSIGAVTSKAAVVTVASLVVSSDVKPVTGNSATLSVDCVPGPSYQWRYKGVEIAGATNATLALTNLSRAKNGFYDVVLTYPGGAVTSFEYGLDVEPAAMSSFYSADAAYAPRFEREGAGRVLAAVKLSDGKFLVGGDFTTLDGASRSYLARLNADATLDTSYTPPVLTGPVRAIAALPDGRVVIGGDFVFADGRKVGRIARLKSDLTLDSTFDTGGGCDDTVYTIVAQADGAVVAAGAFTTIGVTNRYGIARFDGTGRVDPTFANGTTSIPFGRGAGLAVLPLPDGKWIVAGGDAPQLKGFLIRLNADGSRDWTFSIGSFDPQGPVYALLRQSDGKIVAAGSIYLQNAPSRCVIRFTETGAADPTFTLESGLVPENGDVRQLLDAGAGRFLIAGNGVPLTRITSSGARDATFVTTARPAGTVTVANAETDRLRLWGAFPTGVGDQVRTGFFTLSSAGAFSVPTGPIPRAAASLYQMEVVGGGKLLVRGEFTHVNDLARAGLARLLASGDVDTGFAVALPISLERTGPFVLQGDGRILVHDGQKLRRLLADGAVDASFSPVEYVPSALALDRNGLPLIASRTPGGVITANGVQRLTVGGSMDPTFAAVSVSNFVGDISLRGDGRVWLWGAFSTLNGKSADVPVVLEQDGKVRPSSGSSVLSQLPIAKSANGDVWIAATYVSRYGTDERFQFSSIQPNAILPLSDRGVIAAGLLSIHSTDLQFMRRYSATGTADASFHVDGLNPASNVITAMALQDDGSIVAMGSALSAFGAPRLGLVRLAPSTSPSITAQPVTVQATPDGSATLSVTGTGTGPLTYQWFREGMAIPGATSTSLALQSLTFTDLGVYHVRVGNVFGAVYSDRVTIHGANPAPTIVTQPASCTGVAGIPVSLSVAATGTGSLSYQWRKSGYLVPGATGATLQVPRPTRADAGLYDVLVADGLSVTTSQQARVDIAPRSFPNGLTLDNSFTPKLERPGGQITAIVPAPGGKFIVSGDFTRINGVEAPGLARVDAAFQVDTTFSAPKLLADVTVGYLHEDYSIAAAVQPDGKVLVIRQLRMTAQDTSHSTLVRLLPNGGLDPAFTLSAAVRTVYRVAVQPDGRIIVVGSAVSSELPGGAASVFRVNADGSLDAAYAPKFTGSSSGDPTAVAVQPNGQAIFIGNFDTVNGTAAPKIVRLTSTGAIDSSFSVTGVTVGSVSALRVLDDGRLLLGGSFSRAGDPGRRVVRLGVNGAFEQSLVATADVASPGWIGSLPGGKVLLVDQQEEMVVKRFSAAGALEQTVSGSLRYSSSGIAFDGAGGYFAVLIPPSVSDSAAGAVHVAQDGTVTVAAQLETGAAVVDVESAAGGALYVAGDFTRVNGVLCGGVARLRSDGSLDPSFAVGAGFTGTVADILRLPDDRLVVVGQFTKYQGRDVAPLVRVLADGTLDASFQVPMPQYSGDYGSALTLMADGRILAGSKAFFLDGSIDRNFVISGGGQNFSPTIAVPLPGGDLIAVGSGVLAKMQPDGKVVSTTRAGMYRASGVVVQPDSKIVVGGVDSQPGTAANIPGVARLNSGFSKDASFSPALPTPTYTSSSYTGPRLLLQEDGRVLLNHQYGLLRLNADGSVDTSFVPGRFYVADGGLMRPFNSVCFMDDGSLLVGDSYMGIDGMRARGLLRFIDAAAVQLPATPATQPGYEGDATTLSVTPGGNGPFTYQWLKNGSAIAGATDASLSIANTAASDAGYYSVVVGNANGKVQSVATYLDVRQPTAPSITTQPRSCAANTGESVSFTVGATGAPAPRFQWRKDGAPISGATNATFAIASVTTADVAAYSVAVSNVAGTVFSENASLVVLPAGMSASHEISGSTHGANPTITVKNTFTYSGAAPALSWQVLVPDGWTVASTSGDDAAAVRPAAGTAKLAEWSWTTAPASPVVFTYTLNAPTARNVADAIVALVTVNSGTEMKFVAKPDPLVLVREHLADTNGDGRISLRELTRVIELYNTRSAGARTGCYVVATGTTEDGFESDVTRQASAHVTLSRYHSADSNRDGRISLSELTRVIELYNARVNGSRTGQYHVESGTEDGFGIGASPGP